MSSIYICVIWYISQDIQYKQSVIWTFPVQQTSEDSYITCWWTSQNIKDK